MSSASANTSAVAPCARTRPSGQHDHAVGVLGDELHVVRDDEDRRALVVQLAQQRQQLVGAGAVLPERRLVEREHRGSGDQRGADREPALLPAGEEERVRAGLRGQAEAREQRLGALADLVVGEALQPQAVRELVEDGVRDELVLGVLEDEPDARRERARCRRGRRRARRRARCRAAAARPRRSPG